MSKKVRTFIDSNVLIAAWRGDLTYSSMATALLDDPNREYVSSPYVQLETMPQAIFNKHSDEAQFYKDFFDAVDFWVKASAKLLKEAYSVASDFGLTAVDALHIAASLSVEVDEFITAERSTSPLSRVKRSADFVDLQQVDVRKSGLLEEAAPQEDASIHLSVRSC